MSPTLAENTLPDGYRLLTASGELDRMDLPSLRATIQKAVAEAGSVILDMSAVSYIDSSVLAGLISESLDADKAGGRLAIVTGTGGIMRSLELKGLMQVLHIAETVEAAIADLPQPPAS